MPTSWSLQEIPLTKTCWRDSFSPGRGNWSRSATLMLTDSGNYSASAKPLQMPVPLLETISEWNWNSRTHYIETNSLFKTIWFYFVNHFAPSCFVVGRAEILTFLLAYYVPITFLFFFFLLYILSCIIFFPEWKTKMKIYIVVLNFFCFHLHQQWNSAKIFRANDWWTFFLK